jgi:hypothetical protein
LIALVAIAVKGRPMAIAPLFVLLFVGAARGRAPSNRLLGQLRAALSVPVSPTTTVRAAAYSDHVGAN